jgi:hypothetical protein
VRAHMKLLSNCLFLGPPPLPCASVAAYSLTHAEAEMLPYIKPCGENPNEIVCEETIRIMKAADPRGSTCGLTCIGSP